MAHGSSPQQATKKSPASKPQSPDENYTGPIALGLKIDAITAKYGGRYVGMYDLPNRRGPFLIFYTDSPDRSKGHDNYYAIGRNIGLNGLGDIRYTDQITIYNGAKIRDAVFMAIDLGEGDFLVSRWHHDYVEGPNGEMLDGGCDYVRHNNDYPPTHRMQIVDGNEVYTPLPPQEPKKPESPIIEAAVTPSPETILYSRYQQAGENGMAALLFDVGEFHLAAEHPVRYVPAIPSIAEKLAREDFLAEEYREYQEALAADDLVGLADAFCDIIYIIVGTCHYYGIPLDDVWDEVHGSNMAKVDTATGKMLKRPDGKVIKPQGWEPPNIRRALGFDQES